MILVLPSENCYPETEIFKWKKEWNKYISEITTPKQQFFKDWSEIDLNLFKKVYQSIEKKP